MVSREGGQGDERRAAGGRALVLEAPADQLELLAEAELRDRPVRDSTNPVVGVASACLDLVVPLDTQRCELTLVARRACELVRPGGSLRETH
jgi:hypothetical protein